MCALSISIPHTGLFELAGFEEACAKLGSSNSRIRKVQKTGVTRS